MQVFKIYFILLVLGVTGIVARPSSESSSNAESGKRLIKTSEDKPGEWLTQQEITSLVRNKIGFMDITDRKFPTIHDHDVPSISAFPSSLRFTSVGLAVFPKVNASRIQSFITEFSSLHNRYYDNEFGVAAAAWLLDQVNKTIIANQANYNGTVAVRAFPHPGWLQPSTIARIQGSESGVVILGAHMDSLNLSDYANGLAPGADDNASGSAALFEAFRAILESGFVPKKSIEFQWYAGEERGLLGSQEIAQEYFSNKVEVISMLNFDCVGYKSNLEQFSVSFRTDYGDADLNRFLRLAVEGYLQVGWTNTQCGYGCSDHASWDSFGFPAASPAEPVSSPYMHTTNDSLITVDFEMVKEYSKLAIGYAVEIGEVRD